MIQVSKNNAVTDQEKREKQIVVKKLAEMEEELKVCFSYAETSSSLQFVTKLFKYAMQTHRAELSKYVTLVGDR